MSRPPAVLAVGRVRRPHGIHGEVVAEIHTDFPDRLAEGIEVGLGDEAPVRWLRVHRIRHHKGCWLLAFEGLHTRNDVEELRDRWLFLPEQDRSTLPQSYYYEHELVGLRCMTLDGREVGTVGALVPGSGYALLEVVTPNGEALVPFTSPIVVRVDLAGGTVILDPPEGLLDGDAV